MPPKFQLDTALTCAKLSGLAYMPPDNFAISAHCEGFSACDFFEDRDTQCYVVADDETIFCVFRGTSSVGDWRTNLQVDLIETLVGSVHRGFARALETAWYKIERHILTLLHARQREVIFCGHSLGGALATLASVRIHFQSVCPLLYTFGSPRIGAKTWAENYWNTVGECGFRVTNNNDVVATVPTCPYIHVGSHVYIDSRGKVHISSSRWARLRDRALGRIKAIGKPGTDGFDDHGIDAYIGALEDAIKY